MTLIAAYKMENIPILIADIVISGNSDMDVSTPSSLILGQGFVPRSFGLTDVCQKIMCIGPDLCIAWSGMQIAARMIFGELKCLYEQNSLTLQTINKCLEENKESGDAKHVSLLGWFHDDGNFHIIEHDVCLYDSCHFGSVYIGGSGINDFKSLLNYHEELLSIENGIDETGKVRSIGNSKKDPIHLGLGFIGDLLHFETKTYKGLEEGFGGAYQIAHFTDSNFRTIDEITFFYLKMVFFEDNFRHFPYLLTKYKEVDDLLMLDYCRFVPGDPNIKSYRQLIPNVIKSRNAYVERDLQKLLKEPASLNSEWLVLMSEVRREEESRWHHFGDTTHTKDFSKHNIVFLEKEEFGYKVSKEFAASMSRSF